MKTTYINLRGERHPLCYNLSAVEAICDEFGSIEEMQKRMNGNQSEQIKALGTMLKILLRGGREYCTEMGIPMPPEIKNPSALIDITSPEAVNAIFESISGDTARKVEVKNGVPTQES